MGHKRSTLDSEDKSSEILREDHQTAMDDHDWHQVHHKKNKKRKLDDNSSKDSGKPKYPELVFSPSTRLQNFLKITDLQNLVLYLMSDGIAPNWIGVRNRQDIQRTVVLMVPGLEHGMFTESVKLQLDSDEIEGNGSTTLSHGQSFGRDTDKHSKDRYNNNYTSPDDYYPAKLDKMDLHPSLKPLSTIFPLIWPIRATGDDKYSKVFSPVYTILSSNIPKTKEEKKMKGPVPVKANHWKDERTPITTFITNLPDLEQNDYVIHPAWYESPEDQAGHRERRILNNQTQENGWVDSPVESLKEAIVPDELIEQGSITVGRNVIAIDCEMCMTGENQYELTRISVIDWDGKAVMDELVKPTNPIIDYVTAYSGITKEMLEPVTTTLADVQQKLLKLLTPKTVVIGHSLDSDFNALKLTHPFIIDTSIIYPHAKGPPLKQSLKWLSQRYLRRDIQQNDGSTGHDSIEDARACLDLVKLKCEKGPMWGVQGMTTEPIFKRLSRSPRSNSLNDKGGPVFRRGGIVDWSGARHGFTSHANISVSCNSDAEIVDGVNKILENDESINESGVDFVWARLRELEFIRRWTDQPRFGGETEGEAQNPSENEPNITKLTAAVASTVECICKIYESLPSRTCFIVYSGTSDMRDLLRLQDQQQQFKREYKVKKWDELTVQWTDIEEQAMRRACKRAREGIAFIIVK
jgi:RNA exonuclease 1